MKTYILDATLITPHSRNEGINVILDNGKITEITQAELIPEKGSLQILASNNYLCSGFIDIHFHGAVGHDTMDGSLKSLEVISNYCVQHGVTSFYPTTWSAAPDDIMAAINNVKENAAHLDGAQVLGVHIEGPYLAMKFRGAQLPSMVRYPDLHEYIKWFESGVVKLITCAPEIPGGLEFIDAAVERDIRIALGHTGATYDEVVNAADHGATQATHLFNGMLGLHHREPGTAGGILADDRFYPQVISDGVHLHPAVVKIIIDAKSVDKVILITDSIRGAGLPDGDYEHKGQVFFVREGIARTPEGGLSGSTLTMDAAIRNAMKFSGKSIEDVISMATSVPAHSMGISQKKGVVKESFDADLVLLDQMFQVEKTFVKGQLVYSREK